MYLRLKFGYIYEQIYILLAVAGGAICWLIVIKRVYDTVSFDSVTSMIEYHWMWIRYYGFYQQAVVSAPPLSHPNAEELLIITGIVYSIVVSMHPPKQQKQQHLKEGRNNNSTEVNNNNSSGNIYDSNKSSMTTTTSELQPFVALARNLPTLKPNCLYYDSHNSTDTGCL